MLGSLSGPQSDCHLQPLHRLRPAPPQKRHPRQTPIRLIPPWLGIDHLSQQGLGLLQSIGPQTLHGQGKFRLRFGGGHGGILTAGGQGVGGGERDGRKHDSKGRAGECRVSKNEEGGHRGPPLREFYISNAAHGRICLTKSLAGKVAPMPAIELEFVKKDTRPAGMCRRFWRAETS